MSQKGQMIHLETSQKCHLETSQKCQKEKTQMKKKIIVFICIVIGVIFIMPSRTLAEENITQEDIIKQQQDTLNISDFINDAKKYCSDSFEEVNFGELFNMALTRKYR